MGKTVTLSTSCGHASIETDRLSNSLVGKLFPVLYPLCTSQLIPVHLPEVGINAQLKMPFFDCQPPIGSNPQLLSPNPICISTFHVSFRSTLTMTSLTRSRQSITADPAISYFSRKRSAVFLQIIVYSLMRLKFFCDIDFFANPFLPCSKISTLFLQSSNPQR